MGPSAFIGDGLLVRLGGAFSGDLVAGAAVPDRIGAAGAPFAVSPSGRGFLRHSAAIPAGVHRLDPAVLLRTADGHCDPAVPFRVLGFLSGYRHVWADIDGLPCDPVSGASAGG